MKGDVLFAVKELIRGGEEQLVVFFDGEGRGFLEAFSEDPDVVHVDIAGVGCGEDDAGVRGRFSGDIHVQSRESAFELRTRGWCWYCRW